MKILGAITLLVVLIGYGMYQKKQREFDDSAAIRKYVETRGTSSLPRSWAGRIGEGI